MLVRRSRWRGAQAVSFLSKLDRETRMRTLLSVLGSLIAVAGTVPYIIETIRGNTKPRIVTWLTWALLTGVAGAASMSAGQLGAAVFALLGTVATSSVVVAGLRYGDRSFTRLDLACLAGVLLGLVLWLSLDNPIFAIWTAILIDFVGLVPTLVHAWKQPMAETASAFVCVGVGGLITSAAIASGGSFSVAALGYPLYAAVSMATVASIIVIRRKSVQPEVGESIAEPRDELSRQPAAARPVGDLRRIGITRPNLRRLPPMTSRLVPASTEGETDNQKTGGRRRAKRYTGRVRRPRRVRLRRTAVRGRPAVARPTAPLAAGGQGIEKTPFLVIGETGAVRTWSRSGQLPGQRVGESMRKRAGMEAGGDCTVGVTRVHAVPVRIIQPQRQ